MNTTMKRGDVTFKWNGGHTVNVFYRGRNVDVFSVGDFSKNEATREDVLKGIRGYDLDNAKEAYRNG